MKKNIKSYISLFWNIPSKLGEKLGWNWLIYNPGVFIEIALVARRNSAPFADSLVAVFPHVQAFCDVGAGTGHYVKALRALGKNVEGFEYSKIGRSFSKIAGVRLGSFDLTKTPALKPSPGKFDLAFSIEVGEHLPTNLSGEFVKTLTAIAPIVVLTCAQPRQGGHGHINCQPKQFWIERFKAQGFTHCDESHLALLKKLSHYPKLSSFMTRNLMVFITSP